jgi:hypothetical protein
MRIPSKLTQMTSLPDCNWEVPYYNLDINNVIMNDLLAWFSSVSQRKFRDTSLTLNYYPGYMRTPHNISDAEIRL